MPANARRDEPVDWPIIENRLEGVAAVFRERAKAHPDGVCFRTIKDDALVDHSWAEVKDTAYAWAAGLVALGIAPEDTVAIASTTRLEWALADLAIMCAGAVTTTVYPTTIAEDVAYIVHDSGSQIVFAEDDSQIAKLRSRQGELAAVSKVVTFDGEASDDGWVITTGDLERLGRERLAQDPALVDTIIDGIRRDQLATLIYTSGTTGRPKGAELTQDCIVYEGAAVDAIHILSREDDQFLWLPLSHVMGKLLLALGYQIGFPTTIDGRLDRIVDNLAIAKPTFMGAAPRIFEKAYARVNATIAEGSPAKQKIAAWALGVGRQVSDLNEAGAPIPPRLALQHKVADRLVLSTVRERFGGRVRFFVSGSAPLNADIARWFGSVGLLIIEGYGLSETSSASSVNRPLPGSYTFGTVGWPVPGTEFKVAEDGEILMKGPGVMRGYHNDPELTAQVLTPDGWFSTGDIGTIDDRGFVRITDRKKDVFKTSGGKYVAPANIEAAFKKVCPYVGQFVVVGAARNYVTALVTLDPEAITGWAQANGMAGASYEQIVRDERTRELVQGYVDELNGSLNRWETIKRFTILPRDLTVDEGELTPSLKLKRRVVIERFGDEVESLYS